MGLLVWLETTDLSHWIRTSDFGYSLVLAAHAIGMALVAGVSFMFCARALGLARDFPLSGFNRLFAWAWFGFALSAISGTLLFVGQPRRLLANWPFDVKLLLILIAGFSLRYLGKTLSDIEGLRACGDLPRHLKIVATWPIVLWLGVILAGRLIGYTMGSQPL